MPLPRKSIVGKTKKSTTRKKPTPTSRARKGERLPVTCTPVVTNYMMDDLAQTLHGSFFTDPDGRYQQVVAVRIDERARKIYGTCQEMYEAVNVGIPIAESAQLFWSKGVSPIRR